MENSQKEDFSLRFRIFLGTLALFITLFHGFYQYEKGTFSNVLWMCHVSNALLAIGFLGDFPFLIRLAIPWITLGMPLWIMDIFVHKTTTFASIFSHLGGVTLALFGIHQIKMTKGMWKYGLGMFIIIQHICRLWTPAKLNVNISHQMYTGWDKVFSFYWHYWIVSIVVGALCLWLVEKILLKYFGTVKKIEKEEKNGSKAL